MVGVRVCRAYGRCAPLLYVPASITCITCNISKTVHIGLWYIDGVHRVHGGAVRYSEGRYVTLKCNTLQYFVKCYTLQWGAIRNNNTLHVYMLHVYMYSVSQKK